MPIAPSTSPTDANAEQQHRDRARRRRRRGEHVAERAHLGDRHVRVHRSNGGANRHRRRASDRRDVRTTKCIEDLSLLRVRTIDLVARLGRRRRESNAADDADDRRPVVPRAVADLDSLADRIARRARSARAIASLITITGGASRVSVGRKRRPRRSGMLHRAEIVAGHRSPDDARMRRRRRERCASRCRARRPN